MASPFVSHETPKATIATASSQNSYGFSETQIRKNQGVFGFFIVCHGWLLLIM